MNKKIKKVIFIFLIIFLLILLKNTRVNATTTVNRYNVKENIIAELNEEGTLNISGTGEIPDYADETAIPWYNDRSRINKVIIGSGITVIGNNSFNNCNNIRSIILNEGLLCIKPKAFCNNTELTEVTIPKSVTELKVSSFFLNENLKKVIILNNSIAIGGLNFSGSPKVVLCCVEGSSADSYAQTKNMNRITFNTLGWTNKNVIVKFNGIQDGNFSSGGIYSKNYEVAYSDINKVTETINIPINWIDKTGPQITVSLPNTFSKSVLCTVNAIDNQSGLPKEAYSLDGTNWTSMNQIEIKQNGKYVIYARDNVGNVSSTNIIVTQIDNTPPEISFEESGKNENYLKSITYIIKATDEQSGLATEPYSWDGKTWTSNAEKTITENGTYVVYVKDALGNINSKTININKIDNTPPEINFEESGKNENYLKSIAYTIKATDEQSGLATEPYSWDGKTWTSNAEKTITENGTYVVYVKDALGNINSKTINVNKIDNTPPEIKQIKGKNNGNPINSVTCIIYAEDTQSGLDVEAYSWDGINWTSDPEKTITKNGTYIIYVKDKLGNTSSKTINISNIYTKEEVIQKKGDINQDGKIDITDLILIKRHIVSGNNENWKLTDEKLKSADINQDGKVDVTDMLLIKRHIVSGNNENWKIK